MAGRRLRRVAVELAREGEGPLGLWLDAAFQGVLAPGGRVLSVVLPAHLLACRLDVTELGSGRSVLQRPLDLRARIGLAMGPMTLDGRDVVGGFVLAGPDGGRVGGPLAVELLDGTRVAARGVATRGVAARGASDGAFRFRAALCALPPLDGGLRLLARVGGAGTTAGLGVTAEQVGLAGMFEAVGPDGVTGWVAELGDLSRRVGVSLLVDGAVVATGVADRARPDLAAAGLGDGAHGVVLALPAAGQEREVGLVVAGTGLHLAGSPVTVLAGPAVSGRFDTLHGRSAHGWAVDHGDPGRRLVVEAVAAGERVLGRAVADQFRGDLLEAGLADGHCAFKIDLGGQFLSLVGQPVAVRVVGSADYLAGSPRVVTANPNLLRFLRRREAVRPAVLARLRARMDRAAQGQDQGPGLGVSLVMPVHDTRAEWLGQAIGSVLAQWCGAWELVCVDDGSTAAHVGPLLARAAALDPRVRVLRSAATVGIAGAVNFGLRAARYGHVAFLDHDDALEPDAVWQLLRAIRRTGADLLYSDEALTDGDIEAVVEARARPAFSYDYYLSHPYFVHLVCVRTELARAVGGWDEAMAISADVDFVLRVVERARAVAHVPAVLYRWRTHAGSTGHARQAEVMAATRGAMQRHLDRVGAGGVVSDGVSFNQFRVEWPAADGLVLVVVPTRDRVDLLRACIEGVERSGDPAQVRVVVIDHESRDAATLAYLRELGRRHVVMRWAGPFNYAAMNNAAVRAHGAGARFVLFLNNDVEAVGPGWVERLASLAARPDVGAVGALLMYADHTVQHAGVIVGFNGSAEHAFKFAPVWLDGTGPLSGDGAPAAGRRRNLGYNCALVAVRECSAVTAACLMMRREVFEAAGGFDVAFAVGFNDTDLCLRVRGAGLRVLYDGHTMLHHRESATRSATRQVLHPEDTALLLERWAGFLRAGDPFYSPLLSAVTQDHVLREDAGCRVVHPARVVVLRE